MHPALADDILQAAAPIFAAMLQVKIAATTDGSPIDPEILAFMRRGAISQAIALRNDVRAHPGMPDA